MIKNIIFDIGNVLTDYRWREFLEDKGFDETMVDRLAEATVNSTVWREYDRGVWTEEEIMAGFVRNDPEIENEIHQAFDDFKELVTPREYAIPWIKELKKKGYRVLYLSNFSRKAEKECAEALDFLPEMDGGILSYRDRLVKPDAAIYELLLSRYGLVAEECVFLDCMPVNVETAVQLGIHGICFLSREQAQKELRELGVDA